MNLRTGRNFIGRKLLVYVTELWRGYVNVKSYVQVEPPISLVLYFLLWSFNVKAVGDS